MTLYVSFVVTVAERPSPSPIRDTIPYGCWLLEILPFLTRPAAAGVTPDPLTMRSVRRRSRRPCANGGTFGPLALFSSLSGRERGK
ncbi:MAG: hypothetical protein M1815_002610 [Lichina confinis]|nr:MAG: hypothetical protein M1815_002610 [Lichina confinis]